MRAGKQWVVAVRVAVVLFALVVLLAWLVYLPTFFEKELKGAAYQPACPADVLPSSRAGLRLAST